MYLFSSFIFFCVCVSFWWIYPVVHGCGYEISWLDLRVGSCSVCFSLSAMCRNEVGAIRPHHTWMARCPRCVHGKPTIQGGSEGDRVRCLGSSLRPSIIFISPERIVLKRIVLSAHSISTRTELSRRPTMEYTLYDRYIHQCLRDAFPIDSSNVSMAKGL